MIDAKQSMYAAQKLNLACTIGTTTIEIVPKFVTLKCQLQVTAQFLGKASPEIYAEQPSHRGRTANRVNIFTGLAS